MSHESADTGQQRRRRSPVYFFAGFLAVALLVAGLLSYLADSSPDGLTKVAHQGCSTVNGELRGQCIAQHAEPNALADGPLAGYTVEGLASSTGIAGVVGVLVTLGLAGGLFWLARTRRRPGGAHTTDTPG